MTGEKPEELLPGAPAKGKDKGKGKGKGKGDQQDTQPISEKRKADILANKKAIMDLGFCLKFNLGKCPKTDQTCEHKHQYFSLKKQNGDQKPKSPRSPTPPKELSEEEKLKRSKMPCPFHARGDCRWGDKCHYMHTAPLNGGVAVPATAAALVTTCGSIRVADASHPTSS